MGKVRMPAQCADTRKSFSTPSSCESMKDGEIIHQNDVSQQARAKNYCNHAPFEPKLFVIPSDHKPRAKVVQETDNKLRHAYDKPKSSLKALQFHDESGHQVKSQRREAAVALLQVMNYYQDDATGRIGRLQDNGEFRDASIKKLARHARINVRRAIRAMRDIIKAGYIKITRQFKQNEETGQFKGIYSIRSFLPKFYIDLDVKGSIWTKWFSQRGWAMERSQKKVTKQGRKRTRAMFGLIKETLGNVGTASKKGAKKFLDLVSSVPSVPTQKETERLIAYKHKQGKKALELFNLDPSRSIGEYYKALLDADPFK